MSTFKLALITGATSGIGEGLARLIAGQGIPLLLTGRNRPKLLQLQKELTTLVPVEIIEVDLAALGQRQALIQQIQMRVPDLIINNAGFGLYGQALSHSTASHLQMLHVDVEAVVEITLESAKVLKNASRAGTILNVSSAAGEVEVFPEFAMYAACKAFVTRFSQSLNAELSDQSISVLVSCPGMVATEFADRAGKSPSYQATNQMSVEFAAQEMWKQILNRKPIHIFNWKYRVALFFSKYMVPRKLTQYMMRQSIIQRITKSKK